MTDALPCEPLVTHSEVRVIDLGRMPYAEALVLQRRLNEAVGAGLQPPTLLLVEHDPVITITARRGVREHMRVSCDRLEELGIDVQETDRGGDITYHGPGQLVAYPILRLGPLGLNLGRYMRVLEGIVIDAVAKFGVTAFREQGMTGVWVLRSAGARRQESGVGRPEPGFSGLVSQVENRTASPLDGPWSAWRAPRPVLPDAPRTAKLCAFGVRVRRNTTLHGMALNVTTNLDHFQTIVPCGLAGRTVSSLAQLLGPRTPAMSQVKAQLAAEFHRNLKLLRAPTT